MNFSSWENISESGSLTVTDLDNNDMEHFFYQELDNLRKPWIQEPHFLPTVTVYGLTFLIGIIGNGLVIFAMLGDSRSRSVTSSFLVSLALADIVFLSVCVPYETAKYFIGHWAVGTVLCKIVGFTEMMTALTSVLNLTAVSIERYAVIVHPIKSRRFCTAKITKIILSCVWLVSMVTSAPMAYVMHTETATYYNNDSTVVMIYCADIGMPEGDRICVAIYRFMLMVAVPTFIMVFCYARVIRVLWISTKDLEQMTSRTRTPDSVNGPRDIELKRNLTDERSTKMSHVSDGCSSWRGKQNSQHRNIQEARKQVIKMLITVIIIFILSWGPKLAFQIMQRLQLEIMHYKSAFTAKIVLDCLPYVQSCINPFVYGFMSKNFRKSMKLACRRHCVVHGRSYGRASRIFGFDMDTDSRNPNGNGTTHSFISNRMACKTVNGH